MTDFIARHIGPEGKETSEMLTKIGVSSIEELVGKTIPTAIRLNRELHVDAGITEAEYLQKISAIGQKNQVLKSFLGLGYHETLVPSVILRNVLENPGWYTAYTPYQAEIAQGRLEALLNFQTMVLDLTGMEVANASLLDEGTAAAEAMTLARRSFKGSDDAVFLIDKAVHPQTRAVITTRAKPLNIVIEEFDASLGIETNSPYFAVLIQYPDTTGSVRDYSKICDMAHAKGVEVMVDGAHAFAHFRYKISDLDCDYYGTSLHKWMSVPLGAGFLYVKKGKAPKLWPLLGDRTPKEDVYRLNHTGTHPCATDLAIGDAIDFYNMIGAERKEARLRYLKN